MWLEYKSIETKERVLPRLVLIIWLSLRRLEWLFALSTVKVKTLVTIADIGFLFWMFCPWDEQEHTEMYRPFSLQPLHMLNNDILFRMQIFTLNTKTTDLFREVVKECIFAYIADPPPGYFSSFHTEM